MDNLIATYEQEVRLPLQLADSPLTAQCRAAVRANPANTEALYALALAQKGQLLYFEASQTLSELLALLPFDARALCQRGHVYIGIRSYAQAIADFELALRIAPEDWDSLYHLGLCYYLTDRCEKALACYARCYAASRTEEDFTAVTDWYYLTLLRLGRRAEAEQLLEPVRPGWAYGENEIYFHRLLVYKGLEKAEDVLARAKKEDDHSYCTYAYGIACYLWVVERKKDKAFALLRDIAGRRTVMWGGFALQAAEHALACGPETVWGA